MLLILFFCAVLHSCVLEKWAQGSQQLRFSLLPISRFSRTHWNDAIFPPKSILYMSFLLALASLWGVNEIGNMYDFHLSMSLPLAMIAAMHQSVANFIDFQRHRGLFGHFFLPLGWLRIITTLDQGPIWYDKIWRPEMRCAGFKTI